MVLEENKNTTILRTSWVFSEDGSNFVKTMLRLAVDNDSLRIVNDQIGGPTSARDIANAILTIANANDATGGVFHFQGAPPTSWAEFAREIFLISKKSTKVVGIPTSEYETAAKRPLNTRLDCTKIQKAFGIAQPDWRKSLQRVITKLEPAT